MSEIKMLESIQKPFKAGMLGSVKKRCRNVAVMIHEMAAPEYQMYLSL